MSWILTKALNIVGPILAEKLVMGLYNVFIDWRFDKSESDMNRENQEHDTERYYLLKAISKAESNEERKALSITLGRFNRGELSDSKR